jgi:hypothetical protein
VSTAARIIDRLERIKQTGHGRWIARCPAHEDRSPSLSIRELDDGRVLLHDFGGCDVETVLSAIGLTLGDLFDKPLGDCAVSRSSIPARDLLEVLDHEVLVVVLILSDITRRRRVNESQVQRLITAAARIGNARDMANPAKVTGRAA